MRAEEKPLAKKDGAARTDALGDPLPEGAVGRLGTVRFRHAGQVMFLVSAPTSKVLVKGMRPLQRSATAATTAH
jgi:hypothetical protein